MSSRVINTYIKSATFLFEEAVDHAGPPEDKKQLCEDLGLLITIIMEAEDRNMKIVIEHGDHGQVVLKVAEQKPVTAPQPKPVVWLDPEYFQVSYLHECEESVVGQCVYTNGDRDCCIFCGYPEERK